MDRGMVRRHGVRHRKPPVSAERREAIQRFHREHEAAWKKWGGLYHRVLALRMH